MRFSANAILSLSQTDKYLDTLNLFSRATSCSYVNAVLLRLRPPSAPVPPDSAKSDPASPTSGLSGESRRTSEGSKLSLGLWINPGSGYCWMLSVSGRKRLWSVANCGCLLILLLFTAKISILLSKKGVKRFRALGYIFCEKRFKLVKISVNYSKMETAYFQTQ